MTDRADEYPDWFIAVNDMVTRIWSGIRRAMGVEWLNTKMSQRRRAKNAELLAEFKRITDSGEPRQEET